MYANAAGRLKYPRSLGLLALLANHAGKNGICHPKYELLAARLNCSVDLIRKFLLPELEGIGWVETLKQEQKGRGYSNSYKLHYDLIFGRDERSQHLHADAIADLSSVRKSAGTQRKEKVGVGSHLPGTPKVGVGSRRRWEWAPAEGGSGLPPKGSTGKRAPSVEEAFSTRESSSVGRETRKRKQAESAHDRPIPGSEWQDPSAEERGQLQRLMEENVENNEPAGHRLFEVIAAARRAGFGNLPNAMSFLRGAVARARASKSPPRSHGFFVAAIENASRRDAPLREPSSAPAKKPVQPQQPNGNGRPRPWYEEQAQKLGMKLPESWDQFSEADREEWLHMVERRHA